MNRFDGSNNLDSDRLLYELRHIRANRVVSKTSRSVNVALDGNIVTSFLLSTTRENNPKTVEECDRYFGLICDVDGIEDKGDCPKNKEMKFFKASDDTSLSFNTAYHSSLPIVRHHSAVSHIDKYPKRIQLINKRNGKQYTLIHFYRTLKFPLSPSSIPNLIICWLRKFYLI